MIWYCAPALLMLLNSVFCFPRGKVTEKPEIPPAVNPPSSKHRKAPTHISEFTDPDTGLNPFLDLEEGPTSAGRNVMEDERRDDAPYFDFDLVEGDAGDRTWGFEEPKESLGRVPARWPVDYKDENSVPVTTTPLIPVNPQTTVEFLVTQSTENVKPEEDKSDKKIQHKVKKEDKDSFVVSQSTVIYASATIAAVATIILLVGACWWRRKLKTPPPTATVHNEVKS